MKYVGVIHEAGTAWRSETDDPQFLLSFPIIRPKYCVFFLEAVDAALDPVLYFDRGSGFDEDDSIALNHSQSSLYVVCLEQMPALVRLRFDPATSVQRFRFWAKTFYREKTLRSLIARTDQDALASGASPPMYVQIGVADDRQTAGKRPSVARNVAQHYRHVVALATNKQDSYLQSLESRSLDATPLISLVVPTFNTPLAYLSDLVESFLAQRSPDAEIVFSDDGSTSQETLDYIRQHSGTGGIVSVLHSDNMGIAAAINRGLHSVRGQWVGVIDHDDALSPHALREVKAAIQHYPDAKFFYTDEVIADKQLKPVGYLLKPSFDPVLLSGVNYINHLSLFRRDRLAAIGGLREGFEGSQDYDLLLRYLQGVSGEEIIHIPFPAYLWRRGPSTYSTTFRERSIASARRAISECFSSALGVVPVEPALDTSLHRPRFDARIEQWPPITVVIPNYNAFELISRVLRDLRERTDYPDLDIVVVDNGSSDRRVLDLYAELVGKDSRFRVFMKQEPFNFSRQINRGIRESGARDVLLLNNDIEVLSEDWLREMASCLAYPDVGIVGAKLLYPNHTLQHAGVIVGLGGLAGHWYGRRTSDFPGPFGRLRVRQSFSAVTGACMLVSRACIEQVGEFDELQFAIAYNDIDYCLRAASYGLRTVWTPFATLVHHESASRGSDEVPKHRERFDREKAALRARHRTGEFEDPSFSPWYTRDRSEPGLLLLNKLPRPRTGLAVPIKGKG